MNACNYNYNLMSIEMLKIFAIETEPTDFNKKEALEVSNPMFIKHKIVNSRAIIYLIKGEGEKDFRYASNFFENTMPLEMLYYFHSEIFDIFSFGIAFFHHIKF